MMKRVVLAAVVGGLVAGYLKFRQVPISAAPGGGSPELNTD